MNLILHKYFYRYAYWAKIYCPLFMNIPEFLPTSTSSLLLNIGFVVFFLQEKEKWVLTHPAPTASPEAGSSPPGSSWNPQQGRPTRCLGLCVFWAWGGLFNFAIYFVTLCDVLSYVSPLFQYACVFYMEVTLNRCCSTLTRCTYSAARWESPWNTFLFNYIKMTFH